MNTKSPSFITIIATIATLLGIVGALYSGYSRYSTTHDTYITKAVIAQFLTQAHLAEQLDDAREKINEIEEIISSVYTVRAELNGGLSEADQIRLESLQDKLKETRALASSYQQSLNAMNTSPLTN